MYNVMSFK